MASDSRISDRAHDSEKEVNRKHLGDFQSKGSLGEHFTEQFRPPGVVWDKPSLIALGILCSDIADVRFPRDYRRTRELVYKWLTDHYDPIQPLAGVIRFE
jgi:hypothetical protein